MVISLSKYFTLSKGRSIL